MTSVDGTAAIWFWSIDGWLLAAHMNGTECSWRQYNLVDAAIPPKGFCCSRLLDYYRETT